MDKKCKRKLEEGIFKSNISKDPEEKNVVVVVKDTSVFRLGECFDSYDDLLKRLASHSKQSMVHYWRRDSRTVQRAYMKTTRPLEPKLVYYYVKYACVFGGQKFLTRGKGQRQSMTMRLDCPAHIMVRANKSGRQLEVISVCNTHNHPITEKLYKSLPQDRKLDPSLKEEVVNLLKLGAEHKYVIEYVHNATGKTLTNKDLFNLGAGEKKPRPANRTRRKVFFNLNSKSKKKLKLDSNEDVESGEESAMAVDKLYQAEEEIESPAYEAIGAAEVEIFYDKEEASETKLIEYFYPPNEMNVLHMIGDEDLAETTDIIIENMGILSDADSPTMTSGGPDEASTYQPDLNSVSANSPIGLNKIRVKLMNIDQFVTQNNGKLMIQQVPDTNENTLLDGCTTAVPLDQLDLNNIVLVRDSLETEAHSVQMLKLDGNEMSHVDVNQSPNERLDDYIPFHTDQDFVSFSDNSIQEDCIAMLVKEDCSIPSRLSLQPDQICESCGRTGLIIENEIEHLRAEKEKMEQEVKMLEMKRDMLRRELKCDSDSREWNYVLNGPVQYIFVDE